MRVLVVGVGRMGFAHAKACASLPGNEIIGLVARDFSRWQNVCEYFPDVPLYNDYKEALHFTKPDAVLISSYTDTHALYACQAMEAGAHAFVEKPLALNKREAGFAIATARKTGKKLFVGYILRHHPAWLKFVVCAKSLGAPYRARITSNQHSKGEEWQLHKNILNAGLSPLVDCGIHYADLMAQVSDAPISNIKAQGRKTDPDMVVENDANMVISYDDGSTFYFESGFGPAIDPHDVPEQKIIGEAGVTQVLSNNGNGTTIVHNDQRFEFGPETYDQAILAQQKSFFNAINKDINQEQHWQEVAMSLAIVLTAEEELKNS